MEVRRIKADELVWTEKQQILELDKGILKVHPNPKQLFQDLQRFDFHACYDGERMVGFLLMDPYCTYFGGCLRVERLKYSWEYNRSDCIIAMLYQAAEQYPHELICMDVDARRDINRELYQELGFSDSIMRSPMGKDHVVMLADRRKFLIDPR